MLRDEIRQSVRALRRHPWFAASVVLITAFAIGANTRCLRWSTRSF
jgi:hypothetical protein